MSKIVLILNILTLYAIWWNLEFPNRKKVAAFTFCQQSALFLYQTLFGTIQDDFLYFVVCANLDLLLVGLLTIQVKTRLSRDICLLTICSAVNNSAAAALIHITGTWHSASSAILSVILGMQLIRMLTISKDDGEFHPHTPITLVFLPRRLVLAMRKQYLAGAMYLASIDTGEKNEAVRPF